MTDPFTLPPHIARIKSLLDERGFEIEKSDEVRAKLIELNDQLAEHERRVVEIDEQLEELVPAPEDAGDDGEDDDGKDGKRGEVKAQVQAWFEANPDVEAHISDVGKAIGRDHNGLRSTFYRLTRKGFLTQPRPGRYKLAPKES